MSEIIKNAQIQIAEYQNRIQERQAYAQKLQQEFAQATSDIQQLTGAIAGLQQLVNANQPVVEQPVGESVDGEPLNG